jgi:hypothetical protein
MIPWSLTIDIFVIHAAELLHGWRLFDYLIYQGHRFKVRDYKWTLHTPYFDESVSKSFQTLDLMGFSSQYYFASGIVAISSILAIVGATTLLRQKSYNAFSDPALGLLMMGILISSRLLKSLIVFVGSMRIPYFNWEGIWGDINIEDNVESILATKLSVDEKKSTDLETERLELTAIQSDQFRERFLERNKPWILRHLSALFEDNCFNDSDERLKLLKYSKQTHAKLLMMETKQRRPGERNDISSDSDDESNVRERKWQSKKFISSDLSIAQLWLQNAKKRIIYKRPIESILSSTKLDNCSRCLRPRSMCADMQSVLTKNGSHEISLDYLIAQYEETHNKKVYDAVLWKSFLLNNTSVEKLCNICLTSQGSTPNYNELPEDSNYKKTRSCDLSSDSDEEEITSEFDPLILISSDVRARLLVKWLQGARHYLGGAFPRKQAKTYCTQYLNNLKKKHISKDHDEVTAIDTSRAESTMVRLNHQYREAVNVSELEKKI